jgi:hypothetical protein
MRPGVVPSRKISLSSLSINRSDATNAVLCPATLLRALRVLRLDHTEKPRHPAGHLHLSFRTMRHVGIAKHCECRGKSLEHQQFLIIAMVLKNVYLFFPLSMFALCCSMSMFMFLEWRLGFGGAFAPSLANKVPVECSTENILRGTSAKYEYKVQVQSTSASTSSRYNT